MNTHVDFEIAKLLKGKGFNEKCKILYKDGELINCKPYSVIDNLTFQSSRYSAAPTIAEVVMWLYEKHGIWITVDIDINGKFTWILKKFNPKDKAWEIKNLTLLKEYFNTSNNAYIEAINYCLTKLI